MALSNDEQRTLDEIECALRDDDPAFVYAVSLDHHRAIVGGFASPTSSPGPGGTPEQGLDGLDDDRDVLEFSSTLAGTEPSTRISTSTVGDRSDSAADDQSPPTTVSRGKWTGDPPNGVGGFVLECPIRLPSATPQ